jgi:hypothetical protein
MSDSLSRRNRPSTSNASGNSTLDALELEKVSFKRLLSGVSQDDFQEFSAFIQNELAQSEKRLEIKRRFKNQSQTEDDPKKLQDLSIDSNTNQFINQFISRITWLCALLLLQSVSGTILSGYEGLLANNMIVTVSINFCFGLFILY